MKRIVLILPAIGLLAAMLLLIGSEPDPARAPPAMPPDGAGRQAEPEFAAALPPAWRVLEEAAASGCTAAIEGRVVDCEGKPVADAVVTVDGRAPLRALFPGLAEDDLPPRRPRTVVASGDGPFRIGRLLPGGYEVRVSAEAFLERPLGSIRAPFSGLLVQIDPAFEIAGTVTFRGGSPPERFGIRVWKEEHGPDGEIRGRLAKFPVTGEASSFRVAGIPGGSHLLSARAAGFSPDTRFVYLGPDSPTEPFRLVLSPGPPDGLVFSGEDVAIDHLGSDPEWSLGGRLSGRVVDEHGEPVPNAVVTVGGQAVVTGPDGRWELAGVPAGEHRIEAGAIGCVRSPRYTLTVEPGIDRDRLDLAVVREGFRLSGRVIGVRGTIAGARVDYVVVDREHGTRPGGRTITAADGTYEFRGLLAGTVSVRLDGGESARVEIAGDTVHDFLSAKRGTITGTVRFLGTPPDRLEVRYISPFPGPRKPRIVGWDRRRGTFRLPDRGPGPVAFFLSAPGFAVTPPRHVDVPEGGHASVGTVTMSPGGTVTGTVLDAEGAPAPGCRVYWEWDLASAKTDETGSYRIDGLPTGERRLTVKHPERNLNIPLATRLVEVLEGGVTRVDFRVP